MKSFRKSNSQTPKKKKQNEREFATRDDELTSALFQNLRAREERSKFNSVVFFGFVTKMQL